MKINSKIVSAILVTGFICVSFVINANAQGNSKDGKKIYEQNCATCHGVKGKGDGVIGMSLNPKPRNFVEAKFKYGSTDKDLYKVISNGKGVMPPWKGTLNDKQINDVIAYVRAFKGKK
jgi:cbb3-type cytochrome c oxidase subunit III